MNFKVTTAVGLSAFLFFAGKTFAEPMDLGNIPKDQVKGWCDAHKGQYLDWSSKSGPGPVTCMTNTGAGILCDKDSKCTGYPPKQQARKSGFSFPKSTIGGAATATQDNPSASRTAPTKPSISGGAK